MKMLLWAALVLMLVASTAAPTEAQVAAPGAATPQPTVGGGETQLDRQVEEVSSELRCVVCQGLSIQDSPSTLAQEMRGVVRDQLAAGRTPEQVKAYFVDRYGEWVLLRPKASGVNLMVYLLPIAVIVGGAAFIFMKARTWTRDARENAA
ncbi:MAG TPA: cytochrome c-type biogenesis protein [Longimicrobiales bacterium]|nr:cytochrome c-type biogenesis protein [Longimicrobiales bacterium]